MAAETIREFLVSLGSFDFLGFTHVWGKSWKGNEHPRLQPFVDHPPELDRPGLDRFTQAIEGATLRAKLLESLEGLRRRGWRKFPHRRPNSAFPASAAIAETPHRKSRGGQKAFRQQLGHEGAGAQSPMTNILSFADYRALADASAEASENHDRMLETIGRLSTVNLLNLSSHEQQKAIKAFYQAKLYAAATSKEFLAKVEKEVAKLGGRQLTSDETLALLMNHEPKAFRVGLQ